MKIGFIFKENGDIESFLDPVRHKLTFNRNEQKDIRNFVAAYYSGMILKWRGFFDEGKEPECEQVAKL